MLLLILATHYHSSWYLACRVYFMASPALTFIAKVKILLPVSFPMSEWVVISRPPMWNKNATIICALKVNRLKDWSNTMYLLCTIGINSILISPRSQWEEYICPSCDELMNDPVQTSCGHRMCCKCFDERRKNYRLVLGGVCLIYHWFFTFNFFGMW